MMRWRWYDITRQRYDFTGTGKRITVTDDDDVSGIVEMLHELHGDDTMGGSVADNRIARCAAPTAHCLRTLTAYPTSLGGWVCTSPPIDASQVPDGALPKSIETDSGTLVTCENITLAKWKQGPQVSHDPHKAKLPRRTNSKRVIGVWLSAVCGSVIRVRQVAVGQGIATDRISSHAEVAAWALGKTTPRQVVGGDPTADEVAAFAAFLQRKARNDRPWEKAVDRAVSML